MKLHVFYLSVFIFYIKFLYKVGENDNGVDFLNFCLVPKNATKMQNFNFLEFI